MSVKVVLALSCPNPGVGMMRACAASVQAKNPSRDMPIGIIGATTVCTVLYIIMCIVSPFQHPIATSANSVHYYALPRLKSDKSNRQHACCNTGSNVPT